MSGLQPGMRVRTTGAEQLFEEFRNQLGTIVDVVDVDPTGTFLVLFDDTTLNRSVGDGPMRVMQPFLEEEPFVIQELIP